MKELSTLANHLLVVLEMHGSEPEGTPEITGQRLGDLPETWRVLSPPLHSSSLTIDSWTSPSCTSCTWDHIRNADARAPHLHFDKTRSQVLSRPRSPRSYSYALPEELLSHAHERLQPAHLSHHCLPPPIKRVE